MRRPSLKFSVLVLVVVSTECNGVVFDTGITARGAANGVVLDRGIARFQDFYYFYPSSFSFYLEQEKGEEKRATE